MNRIECLLLSSTIDFSTDLVCYELSKLGTNYLRLNRDEFENYDISIDLNNSTMYYLIDGKRHSIQFDTLKSVYYRAPVFLRTQSKKTLTLEEQLKRNQWSAFLRNILVLGKAKWINNPADVFIGENKLLQLRVAKECGIKIPDTILTNSEKLYFDENSKYVVKSLDTALFYDLFSEKELFTYSSVLSGKELSNSRLSDAPVIIQEYLSPKVDCRVTYIDGTFIPFMITHEGNGYNGDWRSHKEKAEYTFFNLPKELELKLNKIMERINLRFGGIDLILRNGDYYFIEVNPTGEWQWLEAVSGIKISKYIADALA